jgi:hypothetical protein
VASIFIQISEKAMQEIQSSNPADHVRNIENALQEIADHMRRDIQKVNDEKAKALFETSAEVILGLSKAYHDFLKKNESAWK